MHFNAIVPWSFVSFITLHANFKDFVLQVIFFFFTYILKKAKTREHLGLVVDCFGVHGYFGGHKDGV